MTAWTDLTHVPFSVSWVEAGGTPTRTLRAGEGGRAGGEQRDAVVMLHGTSGHLEAFTRVVAPHAERYEVHAIDMLGHGWTGDRGEPQEIAAYVEHLVDYLDAVGLERAHLVGESLGGWVAARLAAQQPDRVASLQLLAAGGTKADPEIMKKIKESTTKAVLTDDVELTRARLRLLMHDPADATEELVEVRHAIYHAPDFVENLPNLLCLQDMETRQRNLLTTEELGSITVPTLVVWGRNNPFGEVPEATAMAEAVPGARLELFDECGHWPQHERTDLYVPLSLDFLATATLS